MTTRVYTIKDINGDDVFKRVRELENIAQETKNFVLTHKVCNMTNTIKLRGKGFVELNDDEYKLLDGENTLVIANPEDIQSLIQEVHKIFKKIERQHLSFFNKEFFIANEMHVMMSKNYSYFLEIFKTLEVINTTGFQDLSDEQIWKFVAMMDKRSCIF